MGETMTPGDLVRLKEPRTEIGTGLVVRKGDKGGNVRLAGDLSSGYNTVYVLWSRRPQFHYTIPLDKYKDLGPTLEHIRGLELVNESR
jgi:hypothetical protein